MKPVPPAVTRGAPAPPADARAGRVNLQIDSPRRIAPDVLQPFRDGERAVALLACRVGKLAAAFIVELGEADVVVDLEQALPVLRPGDRMLVTFPVSAERRYVLQATVKTVRGDRVCLRYHDPRYEPRRFVRLVEPVTLRVLPAGLVEALERGAARLSRDPVLPAANDRSQPGRVIDSLEAVDRPDPAGAAPADVGPEVAAFGLRDISLGGACLALSLAEPAEELSGRLVRIALTLPAVAPGEADTDIRLELVAMVRRDRTVGDVRTLHVRFLARLPSELDAVLAELEPRTPADPSA
jgi:hypothetical protein